MRKIDKSILIANTLDHFDTAMYAFLAPYMAPFFFPVSDPVIQLILAYSVLASSIFTRPLGAWIFGILAKKKGPQLGLSCSLAGVSIFTLCLGLLPTYESIGFLAPVCLILVRMLRGFFFAGESSIAKLYLLENKEYKQAYKASYLYQSSTMVGIILSSIFALFIPWRWCFILGSSVGIFAYTLRQKETTIPKVKCEDIKPLSLYSIWQERINITQIIITTGVTHITYAFPFIILNTLMPLVSNITLETMMKLNTALLVFDAVLLWGVGSFVSRFSVQAVLWFSLVMLLLGFPSIAYLKGASLLYVTGLRIWFVVWGVVFSIPLNLYYKQLFRHTADQYLFVGVANAIGASTIGKLTPSICLSLFYFTGQIWGIAVYFSLVVGLGLGLLPKTYFVYFQKKQI